jgi:hypothetical protein
MALQGKSDRLNPRTEFLTCERDLLRGRSVNVTVPLVGGGVNLRESGYCRVTFILVDG